MVELPPLGMAPLYDGSGACSWDPSWTHFPWHIALQGGLASDCSVPHSEFAFPRDSEAPGY